MDERENINEDIRKEYGRRPRINPNKARDEDDRSIEALLKDLEANVKDASNVPFSNKCMLDREETLYLIHMMQESLPEELERARWVLQQNHQLINEARREADAVIRDAEVQMAAMIDEHEVTLQAQQAASLMIEEAKQQSENIRNGAINYTREILENLEEHLTNMLVNIKENQKALD